jgi:hypothetical protein
MYPHDRVPSERGLQGTSTAAMRMHVTADSVAPADQLVMLLRLCLRRPNAGCMTWFSPSGENYAHTGAFTGSMDWTRSRATHQRKWSS